LLNYIYSKYRTEYKAADSLLPTGKIALPYFKYLFKPSDVHVEGKDNEIQGFVSKSALNVRQRYKPSIDKPIGCSKILRESIKTKIFNINV
jgi:hypothetical protein